MMRRRSQSKQPPPGTWNSCRCGFVPPPSTASHIPHHAPRQALLLRGRVNLAGTHPTTQATPLHNAAAGGWLEAARILVSAGAPLEARDVASRTPLAVAAGLGHLPVVNLLLDHGADPLAPDSLGLSPAQTVGGLGVEVAQPLADAITEELSSAAAGRRVKSWARDTTATTAPAGTTSSPDRRPHAVSPAVSVNAADPSLPLPSPPVGGAAGSVRWVGGASAATTSGRFAAGGGTHAPPPAAATANTVASVPSRREARDGGTGPPSHIGGPRVGVGPGNTPHNATGVPVWLPGVLPSVPSTRQTSPASAPVGSTPQSVRMAAAARATHAGDGEEDPQPVAVEA